MNHDYAHCADFRKDCPEDCFWAQLVRDLEKTKYPPGLWISWMYLGGTEDCKRGKVDKCQ